MSDGKEAKEAKKEVELADSGSKKIETVAWQVLRDLRASNPSQFSAIIQGKAFKLVQANISKGIAFRPLLEIVEKCNEFMKMLWQFSGPAVSKGIMASLKEFKDATDKTHPAEANAVVGAADIIGELSDAGQLLCEPLATVQYMLMSGEGSPGFHDKQMPLNASSSEAEIRKTGVEKLNRTLDKITDKMLQFLSIGDLGMILYHLETTLRLAGKILAKEHKDTCSKMQSIINRSKAIVAEYEGQLKKVEEHSAPAAPVLSHCVVM